MIRVYKETGDKLSCEPLKKIDEDTNIEERTWIDISNPSQSMLEILANKTGIPLHFLLSSLDEEETARIDNEDDSILIVLDVPCIDTAEKDLYTTKPLIIAYNELYYVTISKYNKTLVNGVLKKVKAIEPQKHVRLTLNLIYQLSKEFISYLTKIDDHTKDIEARLHSTMKNKELFELMDLNKTLVYFATALNANKAVLSKLLKSSVYKKFEADFDLMEDTEVELDQAIEMCSIYRSILAGMMDAFGSIISNNLNIVMKTLTIITIVISIPTLIASFYGMNFSNIPLANNQYGFYIISAIAFVIAIIGAVILYFITKNNRNRH